MIEMRVFPFSLFFLTVISLWSPLIPTSDACICGMSPENCSSFATADAVFEATVESIELKVRPLSSPNSIAPEHKVVTLRDVRAWRGQAASTVVTDTSCGYDFVPGVRYLITASRGVDLAAALIPERGRQLPVNQRIKADALGRFEFPGWEGFRYGIVLGTQYFPIVMLDFVANGTPIRIQVPQR